MRRPVARAAGRFVAQSLAVSVNSSVPLLLVFSLASLHAAASPEAATAEPDSSRTYRLAEVLVRATRIPDKPSQLSSSVTIIDPEALPFLAAPSLASALGSVGSLFVKDYGGSAGIKTLSERGMGSEHTIVLLNGMRLSSFENGLVDLGMIPLDDLKRVEVVRGGESAAYGPDAVAGVVNLLTTDVPSGTHATVNSVVGSFGFRRAHAAVSYGTGTYGLSVGAGSEHSDGDFPFSFTNGPFAYRLRRQDNDLSANFANLQLTANIDTLSRLSLYASSYASERGAAGPVAGPVTSSAARQWDTENIIQLNGGMSLKGAGTFSAGFQLHDFHERYVDRGIVIGAVPLDDYFRNRDASLDAHLDVTPWQTVRVVIGTELGMTAAEGNSLTTIPTRYREAAYGNMQIRFGADTSSLDLRVLPAIRFDRVGAIATVVSPQLGARLGLWNEGWIRPAIRGNISRNFRAPTFNELYYNVGGGIGNPDLQPERSTSLDGGVNAEVLAAGDHYISVDYYRISMDNRIVWVPAGSASVTPKNIRGVLSQGVEVEAAGGVGEGVVQYRLSYTNGSAIKTTSDGPGDATVNTQLVYVPKETGAFSLTLRPGVAWGLVGRPEAGISAQFVGYRFTSQDNTSYLPAVWLFGVHGGAEIEAGGVRLLGVLSVENVLNREYEIIDGYPMPPRMLRFALRVQY